jgi:hypothetical protein
MGGFANATVSELELCATEIEKQLLVEVSKSLEIHQLLKAENEACKIALQVARGALPGERIHLCDF